MIQNNRPRYWVSWFDRWHLIPVVLLALLLCMIAYLGLTVRPAPTVIQSPGAGQALASGKPIEIKGTAQPNTTVQIYNGDKLLGQVQSDASGNFQFTVPAGEPGAFNVRAVANVEGNRVESSVLALQVAAPPTAVPTLVAVAPTATPVPPTSTSVPPTATPVPPTATPVLPTATAVPPTAAPTVVAEFLAPKILSPAGGDMISGGQPVAISGIAAPDRNVRIYDGDKLLGEVKTDASGKWQYQATGLPAGNHVLTAQVVDASGKTVATSPAIKIGIAAGPTIDLPANGQVASGSSLSGQAAPGSVVSILIDGKVVGTATADANGKWQFKLPNSVSTSTHDITVSATSADGKTALGSSASAKLSVVAVLMPTTGQLFANFSPWFVFAALLILAGLVIARR